MTPIIKVISHAIVKGEGVTITGEVFTDPVEKNENHKLFTRITFMNKDGVAMYQTRYFEDQLTEPELEKEVENFKQKMIKDFSNLN